MRKNQRNMTQRLLTIAAVAMLLTACNNQEKAPTLNSASDTLSWALGENIAMTIQETSGLIELDNELVQQAIRHTLRNGKQPLDDIALRDAINYILFSQQTEMMRRNNKAEQEITQQQEEYFSRLAQEHPSVKQHPSGFYYEELKEGHGRNVKEGDRISFDYRSYLMLSGEPYDQTYGKRDPIVHVVGKPMFQGLVEGMQLMKAGSIYRFYFPYQLAFGAQGSGDIPGFTPFIYEVEIHEIYKN